MSEIVKKGEVEELLGYMITDEQFNKALGCQKEAGVHIQEGAPGGSAAALVSCEADRGICQKPCFIEVYYGFVQHTA